MKKFPITITRMGNQDGFNPEHNFVKSWFFDDASEAILAHYCAEIAENNGMTANDLQNVFPAIMRILKSKSEWAN